MAIIVAIKSTSFAASQPTIVVTPFLQTVRIEGDQPSKSFEVTYTNQSDKIQALEFSVLDFGSLDESGGLAFEGSALIKKYGLSNWLSLAQPQMELAPGQSGSLTVNVNNDTTLSPGGHYAAVIAKSVQAGATEANPVGLEQKISSLVLATKVGGEHYDMTLLNVKTDGNKFHLPTTMDLTFKATGNVHVVPRGSVSLVGGGHEVARGVINESSDFVLPETSRKIPVDLKPISSPKWWQTSYKLRIDYRYDGIDRLVSREVQIRYYNAKAFVAVGLILAAAMYLIWKFGRQIANRVWKTFHRKSK